MSPAARAACATIATMLMAVSVACGGGDRQGEPAEAQSDAASTTGNATTGNAAPGGAASAGTPAAGAPANGTAAEGTSSTGTAATGAPAKESGAAAQPTFGVTLYFADAQGRLQPEARDIPWGGQPAELARHVVQALVDGPGGPAGTSGERGAGLTAVMPADAGLLEVYIGDDGTAYVDFDTAFARGLSSGSEDLLLAVTSITESLAANLPQVRRVQILVDGEEARELGGHLDLSRPLVPRLAAR